MFTLSPPDHICMYVSKIVWSSAARVQELHSSGQAASKVIMLYVLGVYTGDEGPLRRTPGLLGAMT